MERDTVLYFHAGEYADFTDNAYYTVRIKVLNVQVLRELRANWQTAHYQLRFCRDEHARPGDKLKDYWAYDHARVNRIEFAALRHADRAAWVEFHYDRMGSRTLPEYRLQALEHLLTD